MLEEARKDPSLQVSDEAWPCPHLQPGLPAPRHVKDCLV